MVGAKWLWDGKERRNGVEDGGIWERRGGDTPYAYHDTMVPAEQQL